MRTSKQETKRRREEEPDAAGESQEEDAPTDDMTEKVLQYMRTEPNKIQVIAESLVDPPVITDDYEEMEYEETEQTEGMQAWSSSSSRPSSQSAARSRGRASMRPFRKVSKLLKVSHVKDKTNAKE